MSNCGSATFAEGKLITNATSRNVPTARAACLCALLGGRKEISHGCWISGMDWLTRLGYGLVSLRFARNSKSGHLMPMDRGKDAVWLGGSGAEKRRVRTAGGWRRTDQAFAEWCSSRRQATSAKIRAPNSQPSMWARWPKI